MSKEQFLLKYQDLTSSLPNKLKSWGKLSEDTRISYTEAFIELLTYRIKFTRLKKTKELDEVVLDLSEIIKRKMGLDITNYI